MSAASTHPHLENEKAAHSSRDSIEDIYGPRRPTIDGYWPERVDERVTEQPDKWAQSACVLCSNGCACDIGVKNGKIVGVRGRAVDRVNKGRLGPKGLHGWVANNSPDRLTTPLIRRSNGQLEPASWEEAMTLLVHKSKEVMERLTAHGIGFYTTGQLFLEEYYALAIVGKAGLSTLHMDGNTRLCTATAATAMRENFGCDGQPGSYTDIEHTDCLFIYGHNVAATQTVLWARMLDRIHGPNPPQVIVVDPRLTTTAQSATVHIQPRIGTNVALLNGIQHLLIKRGYINKPFLDSHTIGYNDLSRVVEKYTPEYVESVTGVPAAKIIQVAEILGRTRSLLSTALQGVYQSNQATAAACQINNINLLLGHIGKPGSGIYQMNGQPTAQNNRESGCNGEYPGFRNNLNQQHMDDIAKHWNIEPHRLPHWAESPTHIMQMLNYIEQGTIELFWVIGTNPLVSLPDLNRIRTLFTLPHLFLVVQDCFMTETAQVADLVLPAAIWGEKTGCFTNVDRTVHISYKAIEPPGSARPDLDIFLEYSRLMGFKDKDGNELMPWSEPEEVFNAWARSSSGRPCDYSGMSYEKLTGGSGIQWPCNVQHAPNGTERLFTDWKFFTDIDYCETYGHDLETGVPYTVDEYRTMNPAGRAILKSSHYKPSEEMPSEQFPLRLSTGRLVYHFHTRTKTGRDKHLAKAGGDSFVQIAESDAVMYGGIVDGDMVVVESVRGAVEVKAKLGGIESGQVFLPFHFGYWDSEDGRSRAGNELTQTSWDPISKQPLFKGGAVRIRKAEGVIIHRRKAVEAGDEEKKQEPIEKPEQQSAAMQKAANKQREVNAETSTRMQSRHVHIEDMILHFTVTTQLLLTIYAMLIDEHGRDMEIRVGLKTLHTIGEKCIKLMAPFEAKYASEDKDEAAARRAYIVKSQTAIVTALFPADRLDGRVAASFALVRDTTNLYALLTIMYGALLGLSPTSAALQDLELASAVKELLHEVQRQQAWAEAKVKANSPQVMIVPVQVTQRKEQ